MRVGGRLALEAWWSGRGGVGARAGEQGGPGGGTGAGPMGLWVGGQPARAPFRESLLLGRGTEMLEPGSALAEGDTVALYPPFSGG